MSYLAEFRKLARSYFSGRRIDDHRTAARAQLRAVKINSSDPSLHLDATSAEVMTESESVVTDEGAVHWYYLTQVVRNPCGEYFMMKTTDGDPFVKHIDQSRAKILLKGKYKMPPDSCAEA